MQPGHLNPARLPLGTQVGSWRVVERRGLGAYGAVYRAVGAAAPSGPVALKLALRPGDERFSREVELLSRIHHPGVPRLVDHGVWRQPAGICYPYLVMELVDGVSLYDWAQEQRPSSRRVLQVLASLARALEATHAAGGVHRDIKGNNALVRDADGQVFLTDFGSGHYLGAAPLTEPPFPPGTPAYRSPEAWRSARHPPQEPVVPYAPTPSDDVFALGVTAWRLVTDEYPFLEDSTFGPEHEEGAALPSVREVNARCSEELSAVTSRMLAMSPEARGSAGELAEALEQAACEAGPEADVPLFAQEASPPEAERAVAQQVFPRTSGRSSRSWLMAASLGGALALGAGWLLGARSGEEAREARAVVTEAAQDGGTAAVGASSFAAPEPLTRAPTARPALAENPPPQPLPGQTRPNAAGRCLRGQVLINGGCWKKLAVDVKDCGEGDIVYKGACYTPAYPPARPANSSPTGQPDAGTP